MKPVNQKAWFLILPVLLCVAFSAILPLMTVVNYSVQDIISPERRVFVGTEWFAAVMRDQDLHEALWRQMIFSLAVLLLEIPLGIALALSMPAKGWQASITLVLVALSLLIEGRAGFEALLHPRWFGLACAVFLAYAATLFGFAIWGRLLARYPAALAAPFALLVPVFGMGSAALIFGEAVSPLEWMGAVLILVGLGWNVVGGERSQ
jgi:drug/metabolite transporter (DMT)-like permease